MGGIRAAPIHRVGVACPRILGVFDPIKAIDRASPLPGDVACQCDILARHATGCPVGALAELLRLGGTLLLPGSVLALLRGADAHRRASIPPFGSVGRADRLDRT